jgi:hypothetical protein
MSETYTIWCIIEGEKNEFPIKIDSNETVGILKQAIKKEGGQMLADIAAHHLRLYHVTIPMGDPEDEDVSIDYAAKVQEEMDKHPPPTELKTQRRKLNRVFNGIPPPDNTLNIIIRLPSG